MALEIPKVYHDARRLTQSIIQVMQVLDLYQAEVARILNLQCADISHMATGQEMLLSRSEAWFMAQDVIRFYQLLYRYHAGQGVAMRNWLRRNHDAFGQTPQLMLVDEHRLLELIAWLEKNQPEES